uniref:Putative tick ixodegrin n=1 Tax=Rhipicephalus microplus TaxID=6941 RepID=A0A6G5A0K6_RHIMP
MTQLLVSCVVLCLTILALQVAAEYNWWYQRRVDPPMHGIGRTRSWNRKKSAGQYCRSTSQCRDNLCCARTRRGTFCKPLARFGYRCTDDQIKGGIYKDACPCLNRNGECYVYGKRTNIGICTHLR